MAQAEGGEVIDVKKAKAEATSKTYATSKGKRALKGIWGPERGGYGNTLLSQRGSLGSGPYSIAIERARSLCEGFGALRFAGD